MTAGPCPPCYSCCGLLAAAESPIGMAQIILYVGGLPEGIRGRPPFVHVLFAYEIAQLDAGAPAAGPAEPRGQARLPVFVRLHIAHVPHKLNLLGQPSVQIAGADLLKRDCEGGWAGGRVDANGVWEERRVYTSASLSVLVEGWSPHLRYVYAKAAVYTTAGQAHE